MNIMRALLLVTLAATLLTGCKKEEGVGGKSEIRGKVFQQDINNNTGQPQGEAYPLPEARVYIIYGDHDFYDDDVRTGPDGLFVFSWLREGDYRVYVVGECDQDPDDCPSGLVAVYRSASVDGDESVKDVGTLTIDNW